MNLFTDGQRSRMRALFYAGGARASFLQSKGLNEPWLQESPLADAKATLYPNPAHDQITVQVGLEQVGKTITLFNSQGQLLKTETIQTAQHTLKLDGLQPGIYFVKSGNLQQKFLKF
ncbi:MAG TPA: T9SS type A sorting domain-containing protein, partial [Flavisolibacter sp.]|nr:T9SS type A sorting domain-containing protein [Flavisolibacter sp.]